MNAITAARKQLKADPTSPSSQTLANLVMALESGSDAIFKLSSLYELSLKDFELAVSVLEDWRLNRYANKKTKLINMSKEVSGIDTPQPAGAAAES